MSFARVRALVVVGVLVVAAVVFVVVALVRDTQGDAPPADGCPDGAPLADVTLPDDPTRSRSRSSTAPTSAGLADRSPPSSRTAGSQVQKPGDEQDRSSSDVAVIRYGPKAVGAA